MFLFPKIDGFYRGELSVCKDLSSWFLARSDTNRAVQSQKMVRGSKFQIEQEEGLYYLCSENKGTEQLGDYHAAHLCLFFCICKKQDFS